MGSTVISPSGAPLLATDFTNLASAQANILQSSTAEVAALNADLKKRYLSAFEDYCKNVDAGRVSTNPNSPVYIAPPKPPNAFELAPANGDGFVFYQAGKTPVCDMPPLPTDRSLTQAQIQAALPQGVIDVGTSNGSGTGVFHCGPKDTWPAGVATPPGTVSSEGITGTFLKFSWAGFAYMYLKVG